MLPFSKYPLAGSGFPIESSDKRSAEQKFESIRLAEIDLKDQKYDDALKVLLPLARTDFANTRETVNEIAATEPIAPTVQITNPKNTGFFCWSDVFSDKLWK